MSIGTEWLLSTLRASGSSSVIVMTPRLVRLQVTGARAGTAAVPAPSVPLTVGRHRFPIPSSVVRILSMTSSAPPPIDISRASRR